MTHKCLKINWRASLLLLGLLNLNTYYGYADESLTVLCIGNHDSTGICKPEEGNMETEDSLDCILSSPGLASCKDKNSKISYNCILVDQLSRNQSQFSCQPVSDEEEATVTNQKSKNQIDNKSTISSEFNNQEVENEPESKADMEEAFRSSLETKKNDIIDETNTTTDSKLFQSAF